MLGHDNNLISGLNPAQTGNDFITMCLHNDKLLKIVVNQSLRRLKYY